MTSWTLLGIILLVARDFEKGKRPPCDAKRPPVLEHWWPCVLLASRGLYAYQVSRESRALSRAACRILAALSAGGTVGPHRRGAPARRRPGGAAGSTANAARTREGAGGTASGPGAPTGEAPGRGPQAGQAPGRRARPPAQDGGGPAARSRGPGEAKNEQQKLLLFSRVAIEQ